VQLYKRGKYWWVRWPGGERESSKQTSKEAAGAWARRREVERADPTHAAARAATLGGLIAAYIEDRRGAGRAPATLEFYEQKLGHAARFFGVDLPLSALTAKGLDGYATQRRTEGASQHTVVKELSALGAALKKAVRWKWAPVDHLQLVPDDLATGYTPRRRWLPPAELDLLLEELAEVRPHYAAAVACAVALGPRASELGRVTRGDLETALGAGVAHLRGRKTARSDGEVAVLSIFRPLLVYALEHALPGDASTLAFGDWPRRRGPSRHTILNACARAGIEPATWNDLRRTHGRWLRQAGVPVELIAEQLRHTGPSMARRVYAQIEAGEVGQQIEALLCAPAVRATPAREG
jgi:integrase